jgi:hypothetical protein
MLMTTQTFSGAPHILHAFLDILGGRNAICPE